MACPIFVIKWYSTTHPVPDCREYIFKVPRTLVERNVLIHCPVIPTYIMHMELGRDEGITPSLT
jgi:hypothetical protein